MNKFFTVLFIGFVSVSSSISCSNSGNASLVSLTLDPALGSFYAADSDSNHMPMNFTVRSGTTLNSLNFNVPLIGEKSAPIYIHHWTDGRDKISDDYVINSNKTLFAKYFANVAEAKSFSIGKIGAIIQDACMRQPEYCDALKAKALRLDDYVNKNIDEYGATGMAWMGNNLADAFARQPEAIDGTYELAELYFKAIVECGSDIRSLGISIVSRAASDSAAMDPECIKGGLTDASKLSIRYLKKSNYKNTWCFGRVGSSTMGAIVRQPQITEEIIKTTEAIYKKTLLVDTYIKSWAVAKIGTYCLDACARTPDYIQNFTEIALAQIDDVLNSD